MAKNPRAQALVHHLQGALPAQWFAEREAADEVIRQAALAHGTIVEIHKHSMQYKESQDAVNTSEANVKKAMDAKMNLLGKTVTEDELPQIAGRGQYKIGDMRGYVQSQETVCFQLNCWMIRNPDGSEKYVSEDPDEIIKRNEVPV